MSSDSPAYTRVQLPKLLSNLLLAAVAAVLALGVVEWTLRVVVPPVRGYSVLPPGANWTLIPEPEVLHGLAGESHVHVNRFGVRGRPFGDDQAEYRILAVGGSTTLCRALDDTEVWTHLVETDLGRTADGKAVWVGNVGRDGASARDHVLQLKYLLRQYPRMDVVVALVGVNDMMPALHQGWHYRLPAAVTEPDAEREEMSRAFALSPKLPGGPASSNARPVPWYKTTALWQLAHRTKDTLAKHRTIRMGLAGQSPIVDARRERLTAAKVDSLPSLDAPMIEYRRNLNAMADLAATARVQLVFVTQPSAWRDDLSEEEERQLWLGLVAGDRPSGPVYFTTHALGRAMARYNATLLEVCGERRLECVDAATLLPHDTTAMYDDVHFNEQGARMLARALVAHFRARSPF